MARRRALVYAVPVADGSVPIAMKGNTSIPLHDIVKGTDLPGDVLVGIFMSPFHCERSPISGVAREISYHRAPYNHVMSSMFLRDRFRLKSKYERSPHIVGNERNIIIGMIRRGSQVDLFIPGASPSDLANPTIGTKVRAGESVIIN